MGNRFFYQGQWGRINEQYKDKLFKYFSGCIALMNLMARVLPGMTEKIIIKHGGKIWAEAEVDKGPVLFSMPDQ